MTIDEMRRLGLRPRQTAFLTVMEWPDPFVTVAWWDADAGLRERRELHDRPTLWDALSPATPGAEAVAVR
jgi:uncharacterized protein (DUF2461 family)